jgi:glycerol-3-phosphate acyltransferase PlsY
LTALWLLLAYLAGSIPTAWLVGRAFGVDLREHGSGNLGATNAYRVLGTKAAVPVVVVDVLKGWAPTALFPGWDGAGDPRLALAYGLLAIAGHVWPVWLGFRGGKGVATGAGVLIALTPLTALVALLVWLGVLSLTRIVSVSSLAAATVVPLVAWITDAPTFTVGFCTFVAAFVWWTHRTNLRRLRRGEELRFGRPGQTPGGRQGDAR